MDVRDFFRPGGGPGRLTPRRLSTLIRQLPPSSRYRTKLLDSHPDDRWGPNEYLLADVQDWLQYVFLIQLAQATGKKPPAFRRTARPTDKAIAKAKAIEAAAVQARTDRFLRAMRSGDWSAVPEIDRSKFITETH